MNVNGVLRITLRKQGIEIGAYGHPKYELYFWYTINRVRLNKTILGEVHSPSSQAHDCISNFYSDRKSLKGLHQHHHSTHLMLFYYFYYRQNTHLPRGQSSSDDHVHYLRAALRPLPVLLNVESQSTDWKQLPPE